MANAYDIGDRVRLQGTFTDAAGTVTDPTKIYIKYMDPSGTVLTHQYTVDPVVQRASTGVYYEDINLTKSGRWFYRWYGLDGSNNYQGAGETDLYVRKTRTT